MGSELYLHPLVRPDLLRPVRRTQVRSACAVARSDNVFGDRNLVCTCVGMDAYKE